MGLLCPYVVTYFFDTKGRFSGAGRQLWKHPAPQMENNGPYNIYDAQFEQAITKQIKEWQKEIGFQDKVIRIKEFVDEEMSVGISERPEYLQDADADDEDLLQWKQSGNFVFVWAKEYWVSDSGEVEST